MILNKCVCKSGYTLIELVITLVAGAVMMMGMLPLIRIAANQGVEMQLQMVDVIGLQSVVERIGAYASTQTDLAALKTELGGTGSKNHGTIGSFYLHSSRFIYFDGSRNAQTTNGPSGLLEIRVGVDRAGPSLSKLLREGTAP